MVDPRILSVFECAEKLVGTDGPVEKISSLLIKGKGARKQNPMVVSIVGVGGLGKTTIVNLVCERLGSQFGCQAFVSVSLRPNMIQILRKILRQVSSEFIGEMDPEELIRSIRKFLKDKRYFIVVDDVWSEEAWKTLEVALIDNNLGSRVIVTTRNVDVANLSPVDGAIYELDPPSYEDSRKLLHKRIFNKKEKIHSDLEEVTIKILKKCGGVPLAIITTASILANIPNKTKYEWYGVYRSMGSGLERDKNLENMREILHLSYSDLPSYLKPCLLYLSMFPEDSEIPRKELIQLWVAEGFVDGERRSNLYDHGERYFIELINRSMLQPVDMDVYGTAKACRVHDMILDLIISLSAQENFAAISGGSHLISPACKIRRLSLQVTNAESKEDCKDERVILPATANMSNVRTLNALGDAFQWMPPLSRFSVLRVLVLKYCPSKNNLNGLGSLHQLRYLELHSYRKKERSLYLRGEIVTEHLKEICFLRKHLEEVGKLRHLKTLDLHGTHIEELPASIVQLTQLECLVRQGEVSGWDWESRVPATTFSAYLEYSQQSVAELHNLTELRVLSVSGLG